MKYYFVIALISFAVMASGCTMTRTADSFADIKEDIADIKAEQASQRERLNVLEFNAHSPHGTERVTAPGSMRRDK